MASKNELVKKLCEIALLLEQNEGVRACELWKAERLTFSTFLEDNAKALFDKYPDHESKKYEAAFGMQAMVDNFDFAFDTFESDQQRCGEYLSKKAKEHKFHENLLEFSKIVL